MLKWHTPLEGIKDNVFRVRKGEEYTALYTGIIVKRGLPQPRDYVTLDPTGSVSANFNLEEVYDISKSGNYHVEFVSPILHVGTEEPTELASKFSETTNFSLTPVTSNSVAFELLEDRSTGASTGVELGFSDRFESGQSPLFGNCTTNQQNLLEELCQQQSNMQKNQKSH